MGDHFKVDVEASTTITISVDETTSGEEAEQIARERIDDKWEITNDLPVTLVIDDT